MCSPIPSQYKPRKTTIAQFTLREKKTRTHAARLKKCLEFVAAPWLSHIVVEIKFGLSIIIVLLIYRTELRFVFEGERVGGDGRLADKVSIQQKPVLQHLRSTLASCRMSSFRECERTSNWDPSCSRPSTYRYPHSTCPPSCLAPVLDLADPGQPFRRAAHCRCHSHYRCHHGSVPALVVAFVLLLEATPGVGEARLGNCRQKPRMCFHEASPKHVLRMSRPIEAMRDVLAAAAAAAAVVAAAVAEGEDSKDWDPVAGKELIEKKSQMMQVKQEQGQLGLDTHMPHRSHGDQLRPEDDPGRDEWSTLLEVQVGEEQAGKTRPNGDV